MASIPIVYTGLLYTAIILMFIDAVRFRREVRRYAAAGIYLGLGVILWDVIVIALSGGSLFADPSSCLFLVLFDAFAFCKTAIVVVVGIHCCKSLNLHGVLLFKRLPESELNTTSEPGIEQPETEFNPPITINQVWPPQEPELVNTEERSEPPSWRTAALWAFIAGGGFIAYTYVLFSLTKPAMSEAMRLILGGADPSPTPLGVAVLCAFAYGEEIVFRLGIQNLIAKKFRLNGRRYGWAIIATAAIWTLGHTNQLSPDWVKMVQIFPVGIALGYLFKRYGLEACIVAHLIFNAAMAMVAHRLIII